MLSLGDAPALQDDDLKNISHPVCIGIGDRDTMVSIAESTHAARTLPNGSLHVFRDMPHPLEKINMEDVSEVVRQFMEI